MSNFLTLCSARFGQAPARSPVTEHLPVGCAALISGTDADYPASGLPQRRKTQRHWLAVWRTAEDADRFMSSPTAVLPELAGAQQIAALKLLPYMQRGADVLPVAFDRVRPPPDQPVAIITSIGPYESESDAVTAGRRASFARQSLTEAAGLTHELLVIPFPPAATDLFTVTTWQNEAAAQTWAYRGARHRDAMAFYNDTQEKARVSFTRCLIAGSVGEW